MLEAFLSGGLGLLAESGRGVGVFPAGGGLFVLLVFGGGGFRSRSTPPGGGTSGVLPEPGVGVGLLPGVLLVPGGGSFPPGGPFAARGLKRRSCWGFFEAGPA